MTPSRFEPAVRWITEEHPTAFLLALVGALYLPWLTAETAYTTLEGLRLVPAREMLESGDWIVPRLSGDAYLAKPPGIYWAIAALSAPFGGVSVLSGRLVSVLCVAATAWMVLAFGRERLGARPAFLAATVVALCAMTFEKGSRAELEALLLAASTLALFALHTAVAARGHTGAATALCALGLGAAILTKGPVPLLAFGLGAAVLLTLEPRRVRTLALVATALGGALLVCVPWVAALGVRVGGSELARVIRVELLQRVEAADAVNVEPFWYYGVALLWGMLPWSLLAPGLLALRGAATTREQRVLLGFLFAWGAGTLGLLSLSSGKEARYLLPTYPAWALLIAWGWMRRDELPGLVQTGRVLLAGAIAAVAAVAVAGPIFAMLRAPDSRAIAAALGVLVFAAGFVAHLGIRRARPAWVAFALLAAIACVRGLWGELYWPQRAAGYPYPEVGAGIAQHVPAGERMVAMGRIPAPLQFYVHRPLSRVHDVDDLRSCRERGTCPGRFLLSDLDTGDVIPGRLLQSWGSKRDTVRLYALDAD